MISLSISAETSAEILIWIALNLSVSWGTIAILMLSLLTLQQGMSFHSSRTSSISFNNIVHKFCTSCQNCITKYFILLDVIITENVFLFDFQTVYC